MLDEHSYKRSSEFVIDYITSQVNAWNACYHAFLSCGMKDSSYKHSFTASCFLKKNDF